MTAGRIVETVGGRRFRLLRALTTRQAPGGPVVPDVWAAVDIRSGRDISIRHNENGTWTDNLAEIVAAGAAR